MGHGLTNSSMLTGLAKEQEAAVIAETRQVIEQWGQKMRGWLGPGLTETWHTLDLLHEHGAEYVCDWVNDDLPYRMNNGLYSIPYSIELNDMPLFNTPSIDIADFERRICDTFDVLYEEGEKNARVMAIAFHPFSDRRAAPYPHAGSGARLYRVPQQGLVRDRLRDHRRISCARETMMLLRVPLVFAAAVLLGVSIASANEQIHIGKAQGNAWTFLPVDVGIAQGLFAKQGLDVDVADLGGDAKVQQAFAAGSIDIGLGSGPGMAFLAKGSPAIGVAAFAGPPRNIAAIVLADSPIKTIADLQGKIVAVSTVGSLSDWLARQMAIQEGWGQKRHPDRTAGFDPNQHCRAQGKAGRCRSTVDRGRFRARRA
jgi:hypothetical protein